MNIIVYAHSMEIGGSQLNAIEIGAAVQARGDRVVLVAEDGKLAKVAARLGLEHIVVGERRGRPSLAVMARLVGLVAQRSIDVVHGYEWPPIMDAWIGPKLCRRTPVVGTVMSAVVAPFIPRSIPLVVGTDSLRRLSLSEGFTSVTLIEPPVNVHENSPTFDGGAFRASCGVGADTILISIVCRLAHELKLEGLLAACRVVGALAREGVDIRLAIVGDGPARHEVAMAAAQANAFAGTTAIILKGEIDDPRPAYAAADIMLGMGGSALRGLAFGKPLVVQGEAGFWRICDEQSVQDFLDFGWYGIGGGEAGDSKLHAILKVLLSSPDTRRRLGEFGRQLVVKRFSLESAASVQSSVYAEAMADCRRVGGGELVRAISGVGRHKVRRKWARLWGSVPADDFNALREQRNAPSSSTKSG